MLRWARLWLLPVLGLAVFQAYLAFREPIFSPVDELQHTDYVRVIAEEHRLPIYGQARVDPILLAVYLHEYPGAFSSAGYRLPGYVEISYETVQFPVYYLLAAPLYGVFDRDPRVAIHALRLENVLFSAATLLLLMLLMRRVFAGRPELWMLAPLAVLLLPGVSLRHSQVTNQVLATLLLTALLATLLRRTDRRPGWAAFAEGALLGTAVLTKLTVAGMGATALVAWATRPGGLRTRLLPASAGFLLALSPWLAWSMSVYGAPLPWARTDVRLSFCPCPPPHTAGGWQRFLHDTWVAYVLPIEWAGPGYQRTQVMQLGAWAMALLIAAALGWGLLALRRPDAEGSRAGRLATLAILGVLTGLLGLDLSLNRFASTDLRELYVFSAPIALLVGGLCANLDRRLVVVILSSLIVAWLVVDIQLYAGTQCLGCPPVPQWRS